MSVARFVADQRTNYRVPHAQTCQWLGLSQSWFYKWLQRADHPDGLHTDTDRRRAEVDAAVVKAFEAARGLHGSPRLHADLRDRPAGLVDDPDGPFAELPVVLRSLLWHRYSL